MVAYDALIWMSGVRLWILIAIGSVMSCCIVMYMVRSWRMIDQLAHPTHRAVLVRSAGGWHLVLRAICYIGAICALSFGLLRPQVRVQETSVHEEAAPRLVRDLVIALDVSRSMLCADTAPHRLAVAKRVARALLNHLPAERVALVLFAGDAFVQCPLTLDKGAVRMFIDALDGEMLSAGSTDLAAPLRCAAAVLGEKSSRRHKMVLLLTDGEDTTSTRERAVQLIKEHALKVAMVGIGSSAGAPVPVCDQNGAVIGHERNGQGGIVLSTCDHTALAALTAECDGVYCTMNDHDEEAVCATIARWVAAHEAEGCADADLPAALELFPYFSVVACSLLLVGWCLT